MKQAVSVLAAAVLLAGCAARSDPRVVLVNLWSKSSGTLNEVESRSVRFLDDGSLECFADPPLGEPRIQSDLGAPVASDDVFAHWDDSHGLGTSFLKVPYGIDPAFASVKSFEPCGLGFFEAGMACNPGFAFFVPVKGSVVRSFATYRVSDLGWKDLGKASYVFSRLVEGIPLGGDLSFSSSEVSRLGSDYDESH